MTTSLFLSLGADPVLSAPRAWTPSPPPPPSVEQGLITVLLSREGEGLAHDPMAREGLSPELGSVDPLRWTQNLSSLLLEEPTQTRGPGELWTLPSHCWGTAVSKCNRQGGNENRARKGRQTCR